VWERSVHPNPNPFSLSITGRLVLRLGVKVLLQRHTKLLPQRLELLEILLVLTLVLDLGLETLENTDGGGEVVHPAGGLQGSDDDAGRGDKIVGEGVVEVALELEDILNTIKLLLEPSSELLEGLLGVLATSATRNGRAEGSRSVKRQGRGPGDGAEGGAAGSCAEDGLHDGQLSRFVN